MKFAVATRFDWSGGARGRHSRRERAVPSRSGRYRSVCFAALRRVRAALRQSSVWLLLGAFAFATHGATASAQRFPTKPLRLVVGYAPGGGVDLIARLLATRLTQDLGQLVMVENRPGATAKIANEYVAKAPPDGYTLLVNSTTGMVDLAIDEQLAIAALGAFAPVSTIATGPMILVVNPAVPVRSLQDLIARAQAMPGSLSYSSSGVGTTVHLYGELFKLRTGTNILHVPYKGTAPALTALYSGEVDLTFAPVVAALRGFKAGRLRPLATTGEKRSDHLPEVPTMSEAGASGIVANVYYGVLAPAGTPPAIVDVLARAIADAAQSADFRRRLLDFGLEPTASTPMELGNLLRDEAARWADVRKAAAIQAQ